MRLNLLLDEPSGVRQGYLNCDPFAISPDPHGRVCVDLGNLAPHLDKGECSEIRAVTLLDRISPTIADQWLNHWVSLLAHGGRLIVVIYDIREVARRYLAGDVEAVQFSAIVHGDADRPSQLRKVSYTPEFMVKTLVDRGLQVTKQRCQYPYFVLEATRP